MANAIDQLNMVTAEQAQRTAFRVLDQLQDIPAGEQIAAMSLMFLLLCQRHQQNPRDVLDKGSKILLDAFTEGRGEYIRALRNYLKEEL